MKDLKKIVKEVEILTQEKIDLVEREKELVKRLEEAQKENQRIHDETRKSIDDTCSGRYFCGVILSNEDVINILKLAMEKPTEESIKIPYQLFPVDEIHATNESLDQKQEPDEPGKVVELTNTDK